MRAVPSDLDIGDMPADFRDTVSIGDDGKVLFWRGDVPGSDAKYEIGLRPDRTDPRAVDIARDAIIYGVWHLHEFARLERPDLMAYAAVKRHHLRPGRTRR